MEGGQIRGDYMLESKANWKFLCNGEEDDPLPKDINLSSVTRRLLAQRHITTEEAIEKFLKPKLTHLIEPHLLDTIDLAKERIEQAIKNDEKILIYGDYDADGVTATVILLKTLRQLGARRDFYIPNRFTEGYGPTKAAFKRAADTGFTVIVTVDTGISAIAEAEYAKELGIDLIITDHHETLDNIPDAYAIIHPKLSKNYSFKHLAGVGIAFKLAQHLLGYLPEKYLDLVAIGTIADLVPLIEENRVFAAHGLKKLTTTTNKGLQALKNVCSLKDSIEADDVGFLLAPRINAVGRLQDASLAVKLLMSETSEEAEELAQIVQSLNLKRQQLVRETVKEAVAIIEEKELQNFIVVANEGWNEGVLGIVASHLVQKYDRPAIVLTIQKDNNLLKGSGRSIPAFDLFTNLHKIKDVFTNFGGHAQAAGMSLPLENLQTLQEKLNKIVNEQLKQEDFKQLININDELASDELTESIVHEINMLAPFGMENPKPKFLFKHIPYDVRQIGQDKSHLKLKFQGNNGTFEGLGFGMGDIYPFITSNTPLEIVGELNINEWNGHRTVQMILQDIKISERQLFDHRDKRQLNLMPFINKNYKQLIVSTKPITGEGLQSIDKITYGDDSLDLVASVDDLFIFDIPHRLDNLIQIVKRTTPNNIHACYDLKNSVYLTPFPTREDFKWVYSFINHYGTINKTTDITRIAENKRWTEEDVRFIIQVFIDLQFVLEQNDQLLLNPHPEKKDLQQSEVYQQRLERIETEKILHYSNALQLKQWFFQMINQRTVEEEVSHGL